MHAQARCARLGLRKARLKDASRHLRLCRRRSAVASPYSGQLSFSRSVICGMIRKSAHGTLLSCVHVPLALSWHRLQLGFTSVKMPTLSNQDIDSVSQIELKRKGKEKKKEGSIAQTASVRTGSPSGCFRLQELPYGVSASVRTGLASCNRKSICAMPRIEIRKGDATHETQL